MLMDVEDEGEKVKDFPSFCLYVWMDGGTIHREREWWRRTRSLRLRPCTLFWTWVWVTLTCLSGNVKCAFRCADVELREVQTGLQGNEMAEKREHSSK